MCLIKNCSTIVRAMRRQRHTFYRKKIHFPVLKYFSTKLLNPTLSSPYFFKKDESFILYNKTNYTL